MAPLIATISLAIDPRIMQWMVGAGFLLGALLVLVVVITIARKLFLDTPSGLELDGFSLSELQALLEDGKITPQEYERAKFSVLEHNRRALEEQEQSEK